jgi:16S rRNA (uracil1498-N3)-methyltransferase
MHEPRFYAPGLAASDGELSLDEGESRHLLRVLRLGPGARVRVFDGAGLEMRAEVMEGSRRTARLRLIEPAAAAPELGVRLTLAQAVLKSDAMDAVVRDATMLGAHAIVPMVTARTVVPARAAASAATVERWQRIAVSAAKQCGRARVPLMAPARAFADVVAGAPVPKMILVEPSADRGVSSGPSAGTPAETTLFVGPEGGWTIEEVEVARASGALPWSLGPMTLRAEIAPVAALAILGWLWPGHAGR